MKNTKKIILTLLFVVLLSGCTHATSAENATETTPTEELVVSEPTTTPETPAPTLPPAAPINTLDDCEKWGDDRDFFRGLVFAEGNVHVDDFVKDRLTLSRDNGLYALTVHCHNTSSEVIPLVSVNVRCPFTTDEGSNKASAYITYGKGEHDMVTAFIDLNAKTDMRLEAYGAQPIAIVDKSGNTLSSYYGEVSETSKDTVYTVYFKDMEPDAEYTCFCLVGATPLVNYD